MNAHALELVILVLYLINFRSRKFPEFFGMGYSSTEEHKTLGDIFKCELPSMRKLCAPGTTKNDFEYVNRSPADKKSSKRKNLEMPFIVLNPLFPGEVGSSTDGSSNNETIDSISEISISDKINIGFYSKI
jgi:hypothetical protein